MAIPAHADPAEAARRRDRAEYTMCLRLFATLADLTDGLPVSQMKHSLQCAARAQADGAREELVVVALLHDVGKALSEVNHPAVVAEMLKGRVSEDAYWVLRTHGDFQASLNWGRGLEALEARHGRRNWWPDALRLARYDAESFDPDYPTPGIERWYPLLRRLYGVETE
jgi:predicted HD phosphohydrolase